MVRNQSAERVPGLLGGGGCGGAPLVANEVCFHNFRLSIVAKRSVQENAQILSNNPKQSDKQAANHLELAKKSANNLPKIPNNLQLILKKSQISQ